MLFTMHVDAIPDKEHDEPTKFIVDGKLTIINEVLINWLTDLNHNVYLVTALILVLLAVTPNCVIVDGVLTISTVLRSIKK